MDTRKCMRKWDGNAMDAGVLTPTEAGQWSGSLPKRELKYCASLSKGSSLSKTLTDEPSLDIQEAPEGDQVPGGAGSDAGAAEEPGEAKVGFITTLNQGAVLAQLKLTSGTLVAVCRGGVQDEGSRLLFQDRDTSDGLPVHLIRHGRASPSYQTWPTSATVHMLGTVAPLLRNKSWLL
eukprot:CAMPEP_0181312532 /NCGR_PEP_ID=MMETSP1101-20121128/13749_1 /TAXON_ID=46948 /ORGANISM="Rhodomonas abbreviata, Strain Caron Lab Isolate" /LENGTH=177 /DNA_ID=CAMNT_0023419393 /DNA_START=61 /DNA_END=592 /DNA_ORIENTATION=+